jgi:predicted amidohydrolase YtcJ
VTATVFHNGTVWTATPLGVTDFVLVVDGLIAATGEQARRRAADHADVDTVDLAGGFLMPSFGDGHAHPLYGGLEAVGPQIRPCRSVDEIVEVVRAFADVHPDDEWIVGASYESRLAPGGLFDARWLDAAVADRPVVLRAWDYHTVWCNSVALQRAGITADTPDPVLGEIPRRADGSPLGTLREWGAVDLVQRVVPERDPKVRIAALGTAAEYYLARGVTWVQDAWVEPADLDTYVEAAFHGELGVRFNLACYADPRYFDSQLEGFVDARRRVEDLASPMLTAQTVKFFADGVVENETGALLQPYCGSLHSHHGGQERSDPGNNHGGQERSDPGNNHGGQERSDPGNNRGMQVWDNLADAARIVDELGLQIHIHAIGDAAVRQALDAIEHVVTRNGLRDRRPVIAHAQLIADEDMDRFARLGVIPNMQPLWAQLDSLMTELTVPRLGAERADKQYRMRSLDTLGAKLAFGSDWPVSSGAPLDGIAVAASRRTSDGEPEGGWTPNEILGVERALTAYTAGVAYQAFADGRWGVIAPGARADLVWLEGDPRSLSPRELPALPVRATFLAGRPVFSAIT